jgi:hypothetical protein
VVWPAEAGERTLAPVVRDAPSSLEIKTCSPSKWANVTFYRHGTRFHPVVLYSPALGLLMSDVWRGSEELPEGVVDIAVDFVNSMNGSFETEADRQEVVLSMLRNLLPLCSVDCVTVDSRRTDGTVTRMPGRRRLCNVEVKKEVASHGDPGLQNVGYVAAFYHECSEQRSAGVVPMAAVTVTGNLLAFSGSVLVDGHLVVEPLTDHVFTRCTHDSYKVVAQMLLALQNSVEALYEVGGCLVVFVLGPGPPPPYPLAGMSSVKSVGRVGTPRSWR